jgi:phosphatidylserine/phosphatidylglycerophosphate/cardiolipin synthase-like enzyme
MKKINLRGFSSMLVILSLLVALAGILPSCADLQAVSANYSSSSSSISSPAAVSSQAVEVSGGGQQGSVSYYFPRAGQQPEPVLTGLIGSAKSTLDIAIYSITDENIANAITDANKRGVAVRLISDKTESAGSYQKKLLGELKAAGIPIKINTHSGLMHLKVSIIDKSIATTGSFNYTKAAENENDEVFVVLNDAQAAQDFDVQFERMWNDTKDFKDF